jgi:hypothetical protein
MNPTFRQRQHSAYTVFGYNDRKQAFDFESGHLIVSIRMTNPFGGVRVNLRYLNKIMLI